MSRVTVIIRSAPLRSRRTAEALRMSLGQSLSENEVDVVLAGDAVYALGQVEPERIDGGDIARPMETLPLLGCGVYAEAESVEERGVRVPRDVQVLTRTEIAERILDSDCVIPW